MQRRGFAGGPQRRAPSSALGAGGCALQGAPPHPALATPPPTLRGPPWSHIWA